MNKISMTNNQNTTILKKENESKFKNTNEINFDINGNKLNIYEVNELDKDKLSQIGNNIFDKNSFLDSIIFLVKNNKENYNFFVYEKNGTFSSMCGNGAGGAMYFLHKKYGLENVNFLTKDGKIVNTSVDKEEIKINLGEVEYIGDIEKIVDLGIQLQPLRIQKNIYNYLENPHILKDKLKNENELTYFLQIFNNLKGDNEFYLFLNSFKIKKLSQIAGEPHILIEIKDLKNDFLTNYYLKSISFLLRIEELISGDVNFMFYTEKNENEYKMFPGERGVENGINFDQTLACGTGSTCLGNFLSKNTKNKEICIENRSGKKLKVSNTDNGNILSFGITEINEVSQKDEITTFSSEAIYENLRYNLEKKFGNITENKTYDEIYNSLNGNFPKISIEINKLFGDILFSTCLHESEFPIDPYKITSSINGSILCNKLGINKVYSPYLDTLEGDLKEFPNISSKKISGKTFKKIAEIVKEISQYTKNYSGIKDILIYIKYRTTAVLDNQNGNNKKNFDVLKNPNIAKLLKEIEKCFGLILGIDIPNVLNSDYGKFIINNYKKIGIYDVFKENLPNFKENTLDKFIFSISDKKIRENLNEIYEKTSLELLKTDFNKVNDNNINNVINKALQNSVITFFMKNNLSKEIKVLLKEKQVLNKSEIFYQELTSLDEDLKNKYANFFELILSSEDFGIDFFKKYLLNLSLKDGGKLVFLGKFNSDGMKGFPVYFSNKNGEDKLFVGKGEKKFEMEFDSFLDVIKNPNNIVNLQGCLSCLFIFLGNTLTIGSERGLREVLIKTLKEHFGNNKFKEYIDFIESTKLVGDYVPSKTLNKQDKNDYYYDFPAGTDNSYLSNLFVESVIFGEKFGKEKTKELIENNLSIKNNVMSNEEKVFFLKDLIHSLDFYNFSYFLEKEISKMINSGKEDKISNIKEIEEKINYYGDDINILVDNLFNRNALIKPYEISM